MILNLYVLVAVKLEALRRDERAVTAVEYAIVLAGVAAIVAVVFAPETGPVAKLLTSIFEGVTTKVDGILNIK